MFEKKKFNEYTSDFHNVIIKNKKKICNYLEKKEISCYKRCFDLIFKYEPHILEKNVESKLAKLSGINNGFEEIFDILTNVDIKYNDAVDSKGKKHKILNDADVVLLLKSQDRKLRKSAWINFNIEFDKLQNTLTTNLFYNYKMLNSYANIRNFKNYVDSSAFADEISINFIKKLYCHIQKFKNAFIEYKNIRNKYLKKKLNLKSLEP
jgi:oligoendopeptidase F